MNVIGYVGVGRVFRICRAQKQHLTQLKKTSQSLRTHQSFTSERLFLLSQSLWVEETQFPLGLLFRKSAICGMWSEAFANSLLRGKNTGSLFPFGAVKQ